MVKNKCIFFILILCSSLSFICTRSKAQTGQLDGSIGMETTGFLQHSSGRADSSTTFLFNQKASTPQDGFFRAQFDLKAITFLSDRSSFTADLGDSFVATGNQFSTLHQVSFGRRNFDWSISDQTWKTGLWSNRFLWDPFRAEVLGLTGAFYQFQSSRWRVLAFASPIGIPERGLPIRQTNDGRITSPSPDWIPLYDQLTTFGQQVNIQYSIDTPSMNKLLLNPGAGVSVKYGEGQGFWASTSYGVLPMEQVDLATEFGLNTNAGILNATLHPRVLYHSLNTAELGYQSKQTKFWASLTREIPLPADAVPVNWVTTAMGPTWISSFGGSHLLTEKLLLQAGYIVVNESKSTQQDSQLSTFLPKRFQYTRATQLTASYSITDRLITSADWRFDLDTNSQFVSVNMNFSAGRNWSLSCGADTFISSTSSGFIGQYVGYDRFRAGVKYVF